MNDLYLSKELYNAKNIEIAAEAFKGLANIKIKQNEKYYVCTIKSSKYSAEDTFNEFENYIIDLTSKGKL